jgi:hypothetical protein
MTSAVALQEARSNLLRKAPDRAPGLDLLLPLITLVETPPPIVAVPALPVDDELILRAAIAAGATHLLTGDKKHFGRYFDAPARTAGVRIQTVRMFLTDCFELRREPGKS